VPYPYSVATYTSADWTGGNVTYVPLSGNLQTYIDNASAGDTLILAAGTYTRNRLAIDKAINIVGQGRKDTVVNVVVTLDTPRGAFEFSASDIHIRSLSMICDDLFIDDPCFLTVSPNLTGLIVEDVYIRAKCNDAGSPAVEVLNSDLDMIDCEIYSGILNAISAWPIGVKAYNDSSASTNNVVNLYNCKITVESPLGWLGGAHGVECYGGSSSKTMTVNLYGSSVIATADSLCVGLFNYGGARSIINAYHCDINAVTYDVYCGASGVVNLYDTVLVNNTVNGTVTYRAAVNAGLGIFSTSINTPRIANLTTNGLIETTGGNGTLGVRTTVYQTAYAILSALGELADDAGYLENDGAGNLSWGSSPGGDDNWNQTEYILTKDRTIEAGKCVIIVGPLQTNGNTLTTESGGILYTLRG
jgi:hypothetical protein